MELQSVMHKRCPFPTSTVRTCRKRRDKSLLFYTCLASYSGATTRDVVDMVHGTRHPRLSPQQTNRVGASVRSAAACGRQASKGKRASPTSSPGVHAAPGARFRARRSRFRERAGGPPTDAQPSGAAQLVDATSEDACVPAAARVNV